MDPKTSLFSDCPSFSVKDDRLFRSSAQGAAVARHDPTLTCPSRVASRTTSSGKALPGHTSRPTPAARQGVYCNTTPNITAHHNFSR
ncbi:hypothetical protein E2C01_066093 [Portunus trituberculatus]|uniref:Uncharacterized protein n=1 Tax=Portunus trituberculatus TaxID=210409 RepID=A0A5B7HNV2_PORTR|nr:hypothetical protein [Portunus trituberculatus]